MNKRLKRIKTMKKFTLLIVLGAMLLTACGPRDKQSQLQRMESQRDALNEKIEQLKAELNQSRTDQPQILVDEGDRVTQGQLLAELDGAIYERNIAEVEKALELAITIFERRQRLWDKNIGSEIEFLQAKNNKENLEKRLETLQEQYKLTKITSPINGNVDNILIKEGEMAAAGFGTIRIVQLSRLKIVASLSENYISRVKKKDIVRVEIPVLGFNFDHSIDSVSQVIDPDNRTFDIEIEVPREQRNIKPNMLAVVTITDYTNPQAIVVPQNIVQKTGTEQFLFIASEETGRWIAKKKTIQSGQSYDNRTEITNGLNEGDFIITFGFQNLADGQTVTVSEEDESR
jgi:RND family efflux transporter MFP subunit